jgi:uncharacterized membrane protein YccC
VASEANSVVPAPAAIAGVQIPSHEGAAKRFWRILTRFDSSKLQLYLALRNTAGVALPLIAGYALGMPRGGLAVAIGALNVSYSDGSDGYAARAKRMLLSSVLCALLVYAAQPLTARQAAISELLALPGGLLQMGLSIALWPVRRYGPERRAPAGFYQELAQNTDDPARTATAVTETQRSNQAEAALSGLGRDTTLEGVRYRALLGQAERIQIGLLTLSRLRVRMERESSASRRANP